MGQFIGNLRIPEILVLLKTETLKLIRYLSTVEG